MIDDANSQTNPDGCLKMVYSHYSHKIATENKTFEDKPWMIWGNCPCFSLKFQGNPDVAPPVLFQSSDLTSALWQMVIFSRANSDKCDSTGSFPW
jgi:hypothetical protein